MAKKNDEVSVPAEEEAAPIPIPEVIGTYTGDMDRKKKRKVKLYNIRFQQNRSFELHVAGRLYAFEPHGSKIVPEAVIEHPDFRQVAGYFGVTEVKNG